MNTRFLLVLSLIVAVLAVWFYRTQGDISPLGGLSETNIEYEATDILAIQTNELGAAEYQLTADSLTHYAQENVDELETMTLHWRPNDHKSIAISADRAAMYHESDKVVMRNNVLFASQDISRPAKFTATKATKAANDVALQTNPANRVLKLEATELIGHLADKTIYSDRPIKVQQAANRFESAGFKADLALGDYEFSQVAVTFLPPKRQDAALF